MIWNSAALGRILENNWYYETTLLCSPSSTWKHGHDAKTLHGILGLKGDNKDIRECRAMTMMYQKHPEDWKPVEQYMSEL